MFEKETKILTKNALQYTLLLISHYFIVENHKPNLKKRNAYLEVSLKNNQFGKQKFFVDSFYLFKKCIPIMDGYILNRLIYWAYIKILERFAILFPTEPLKTLLEVSLHRNLFM